MKKPLSRGIPLQRVQIWRSRCVQIWPSSFLTESVCSDLAFVVFDGYSVFSFWWIRCVQPHFPILCGKIFPIFCEKIYPTFCEKNYLIFCGNPCDFHRIHLSKTSRIIKDSGFQLISHDFQWNWAEIQVIVQRKYINIHRVALINVLIVNYKLKKHLEYCYNN